MGKLIEGVWDCPYCEAHDIKASRKSCPTCGHPQDKNTKFRLSGVITYVDEQTAAKISKKPDWECSFCGSLNKDDNDTCVNCGALKSDSERNYFEMRTVEDIKHIRRTKQETNQHDIPNDTPDDSPKQETYEEHIEPKDGFKTPTIMSKIKPLMTHQNLKSAGCIAGGIALFILLCLCFVTMFTPKPVTVSDFSWFYNIDIEELQTFEEDDWSLPPGARLDYTNQEIISYDSVLDHYETITEQKTRSVIDHYETVVTGHRDLGNGYFEEITSQQPVYTTEYYTETHEEPVYRQEPVYATKYYYEIDRWTVIDAVITHNTNKEPYWGDVNLKDGQRIGAKTDTYYVTVIDQKEKSHTYVINKTDWDKLNYQDEVQITTALGLITEVIYPES